MTSCTNDDGLSIINFGIGSSNAATIMDLLSAISPKGVLFLGKCGGLKKTTDIGHFILPTAAIRGEGTSDDYFPKEVPAMPSFKLHKYVSAILVEKNIDEDIQKAADLNIKHYAKINLTGLGKSWLIGQKIVAT